MSLVPYRQLKSATDPGLKSFTIKTEIDGSSTETYDTITMYRGYWKSATVLNTNKYPLTIREEGDGQRIVIPPMSSMTFQGWGSFFQLIPYPSAGLEAGPAMHGLLTFEIVLIGDALDD